MHIAHTTTAAAGTRPYWIIKWNDGGSAYVCIIIVCACTVNAVCVYVCVCLCMRVYTHGCRQSKHARALRNPIIFGGPPHTADKGITPNVALNWHTRLKIIRHELCNWKIPTAYVQCLFRGIEMEKKSDISLPLPSYSVAENYTYIYRERRG